MKKMKKLSILCLCFAMIFSMTFASNIVIADEAETAGEEQATTGGNTSLEKVAGVQLSDPVFELVAETDKVALYADKAIGEIKFVDKINGTQWLSNPADKNSSIDIGENKERLYSQFSIEYTQGYNHLTTNSSMDSLKYTKKKNTPSLASRMFNKLAGLNENAGYEEIVLGDCFKTEAVENGIKFIYTMPRLNFKIVLQYTVKDDYMEVSILTDESIFDTVSVEKQSTGDVGFNTRIAQIDYHITRIDLLPMFGAAGMNDTGYMFLPDESGVIVNYNNGRENYDMYDMPVYGRYYNTKEYARKKNGVYMPVFGTVNNQGTLMGIVTEGAAASFMRAYIAGKDTAFNNVYSSVQVNIVEDEIGETDGIPYTKSLLQDNNYTVRYYALGSDNGGYVGMANKYRDYLINDKKMEKKENGGGALFLDVYGQVNKDKNILGVPVEMPEKLTGYDELQDMVETLKGEGISDPTIRYTNWQSASIDGKVNEKVKASSYLGGNDGLKELFTYMEENKINFYPNIDYVNYSKGTLKHSRFKNAAKELNQSPKTIVRNRVPMKLGTKWYMLKPTALRDGVDSFLDSYVKKSGHGIAVESIGSMVYSDYQKGSTVRTQTEKVWEEVLINASNKTGKVMVDGANAYCFPYVDAILTTPTTDAYCEIADATVPFYQMVLHGFVDYGTEALNLSADPDILRLKAIETGAALTYSVFTAPSSDVKGTYMDYLFSANFDLVKEKIINNYKADKDYYEKIKGQKIVNHSFAGEDITITTYENGISAVVNYTDNEFALADGSVVPAMSYIVK
ncbi:MAG: hypothetical protein IJC89_05550 [Clostridia bacterium]|nr:hypothetical protein [Clostridia bacterium]